MLLFAAVLLAATAASGDGVGSKPASRPASAAPAPPTEEMRAAFRLSPRYVQCVVVEGMPLVATAAASPFALREAEYLLRSMVGPRLDLVRTLAAKRVRFVAMATTEMTTDVPEHSDLAPAAYWNKRARGLGATPARPAVSCGEENLLGLDGDPYAAESIFVHEMAHALDEMAMRALDATFEPRLRTAYDHARAAGLWKGTYAMQNPSEYWAEGAQSWFDTNRRNDSEHNDIDTREKLKAYDPTLADLLREAFGDRPWKYMHPTKRADAAHLAGFERGRAPHFAWPRAVLDAWNRYEEDERRRAAESRPAK